MTIDELEFIVLFILISIMIYSYKRSIQSIIKYMTLVIYLVLFYSYLIFILLNYLEIKINFYIIPIILSLLIIFINILSIKIKNHSKINIDISFYDLFIIFGITAFYLLFKNDVITYDTLAFFIPLGYDMIHYPSLIPYSSVFGTNTAPYPYFIALLLFPTITKNIETYKLILEILFYFYILNMMYFGYKFIIILISKYINIEKKMIRIVVLLYLFVLFSMPYFYIILTQYYLHPSILLSYFFLVLFEKIFINNEKIRISDIYIYLPLALSYDSMLLTIGLFLISIILFKLIKNYSNNKIILAIIYIILLLFIMIRNFPRYDFIIRLNSNIDKYVVIMPSLIIFSIIAMIIYQKLNLNSIQNISILKTFILGLIILILIFPYLNNYLKYLSIYNSNEYIFWQKTISSYSLIQFFYNNISSYYYYILYIVISLFFLIFKKINFNIIYLLLIFIGTLLGLLVVDLRHFVFLVLLLFVFLLSLLSYEYPNYSLLIILFIISISYIFNNLIYPVFVIRNDINLLYYNEIAYLLINTNCSKIFYFNLPFILSYSYYSNNTYLIDHLVPYDLIRFEFYFSLSHTNYHLLFSNNSCLILSKYQTTLFDKLYTRFYSRFFIISDELSHTTSFLVYRIKTIDDR